MHSRWYLGWPMLAYFHTTKDHYVRSGLHCTMMRPGSGQITNITPASVFIFGDYWSLEVVEIRSQVSTANDQNRIICWDCIVGVNSKNKLKVFVFEYRAGAIKTSELIKTGNTALRMLIKLIELRQFEVTQGAKVCIGTTRRQKINIIKQCATSEPVVLHKTMILVSFDKGDPYFNMQYILCLNYLKCLIEARS